MSSVGIIANPAAGKDIRRLVAYGTVFDNMEKVNIVKRILLGLAAVGVQEVWYMPEYFGIVPRAQESVYSQHCLHLRVVPLPLALTCTPEDSRRAAEEMARLGVKCIITLGGDGTNRVVAKGCGEVPLLPLSTGTNNVFPQMLEGTIAGLAAGLLATGKACGRGLVKRCKRLSVVENGMEVDMALVDVALIKDTFIGSRAVWEPGKLRQLVLTRSEAVNIGLSSIGARFFPLDAFEPMGMEIEVGVPGEEVLAPIAPGLVVPVTVRRWRLLRPGEEVEVEADQGVLALDGEREIELRGREYGVRLLDDGPWVVDVETVLRSGSARETKEDGTDGRKSAYAQAGPHHEARQGGQVV